MRNAFNSWAVLFGALLAAGSLGGCSSQNASAAPAEGAAAATPAAAGDGIPEVLATIGDEQVTLADIRARVGDDLDKLSTRYRLAQHKLVETTLQQILRERVILEEARKQGKSMDQMILDEAGGTLEPTDLDLNTWYTENQSLVRGRSLDQVRPQVVDLLRKERRNAAVMSLEKRLNQERKVTVHLEPVRFEVDDPTAPSLGPANAPVTLVEFSDFQCPFCGAFHPTLKRLHEAYGDKLRIVYRQYPIASLHPNAVKAAEASLCAHDQGKFWEAHDVMFQEQKGLAVRDLKAIAGRLGMDQKKFDTCLDTGRYTEKVQDDLAQGGRAGVNGTPALFVNGVVIEGGAVPYETMVRAIDTELARVSK